VWSRKRWVDDHKKEEKRKRKRKSGRGRGRRRGRGLIKVSTRATRACVVISMYSSNWAMTKGLIMRME
jgi:hypothetical protein